MSGKNMQKYCGSVCTGYFNRMTIYRLAAMRYICCANAIYVHWRFRVI